MKLRTKVRAKIALRLAMIGSDKETKRQIKAVLRDDEMFDHFNKMLDASLTAADVDTEDFQDFFLLIVQSQFGVIHASVEFFDRVPCVMTSFQFQDAYVVQRYLIFFLNDFDLPVSLFHQSESQAF